MQHSPQQPRNTEPSIPGYRSLQALGTGHDANLYLAHQDKFNRRVVLKIASPTDDSAHAPDAASNRRIVREAQGAAHQNHQHIIRVFDVGEHNGQSYLAMEYLEGGDLRRRLQYDLTIERALTIAKQIASALDHIHGQGYVHGNLSPDHILLDKHDKAILSNFSRALPNGSEQPEQTGLERRSDPPQYNSPEQIRGKVLDGRADFYRLGVTLYEMLMGVPPFDHPEVTSLSMMILNAPVPRVAQPLAPLQPLLDGLLSKDLSARYASGRELINDIEKLQGAVTEQQVHRKRPLPANPAHSANTIIHPLGPNTSAPNRGSKHRILTRRQRPRRRGSVIFITSAMLLSGMYYLYHSGGLQQWADHGAASPNPQARMLASQVLAILPETRDASAHSTVSPSAQDQKALIISTDNFGTAVTSQLTPGHVDSSMIAIGAALALSDIEAKQ